MKTFIEQKREVEQEIESRERENESLLDRIDHNDTMIKQLKENLARIGKPAEH